MEYHIWHIQTAKYVFGLSLDLDRKQRRIQGFQGGGVGKDGGGRENSKIN